VAALRDARPGSTLLEKLQVCRSRVCVRLSTLTERRISSVTRPWQASDGGTLRGRLTRPESLKR
jgi:hypothetical protein